MKILMATHYFASHQGGIEIVAGHLFRELSALQIVWAATDATPPPEATGAARVVCLRASNFVERQTGLPCPIPTLGTLRKLRDEVRRADVVLIHDCLYLTNIATYLFARSAGIPVILIQHIGLVSYSNRLLSGLMKLANALITRNMLRGAQQVVFISETTKLYFGRLSFRSIPAVIFNGVDTETFRPPDEVKTKESCRRQFGLPTDRPVVLFVGRFVEKKGLAVLQRMVAMAPGYSWVFAGWGPLDPRNWEAANVHVFSDLHGSSLAELYAASDLFVLPSTGEGFPLVIQEALACGLPVVCGSETAMADPALAPLIQGVDLQPGDEDRSARNFVAAVNNLLKSSAKLDYLQEVRRGFVQSHYSWKQAATRYLEIAARLVPETENAQSAMSDQSGPGKRAQVASRGAAL